MEEKDELEQLIPFELVVVARITYLASFIFFFISIISLTLGNHINMLFFLLLTILMFSISRGLQRIEENARKASVGVFSLITLVLLIFRPLDLFLSLVLAVICIGVIYILQFHKATRFIFEEISLISKTQNL